MASYIIHSLHPQGLSQDQFYGSALPQNQNQIPNPLIEWAKNASVRQGGFRSGEKQSLQMQLPARRKTAFDIFYQQFIQQYISKHPASIADISLKDLQHMLKQQARDEYYQLDIKDKQTYEVKAAGDASRYQDELRRFIKQNPETLEYINQKIQQSRHSRKQNKTGIKRQAKNKDPEIQHGAPHQPCNYPSRNQGADEKENQGLGVHLHNEEVYNSDTDSTYQPPQEITTSAQRINQLENQDYFFDSDGDYDSTFDESDTYVIENQYQSSFITGNDNFLIENKINNKPALRDSANNINTRSNQKAYNQSPDQYLIKQQLNYNQINQTQQQDQNETQQVQTPKKRKRIQPVLQSPLLQSAKSQNKTASQRKRNIRALKNKHKPPALPATPPNQMIKKRVSPQTASGELTSTKKVARTLFVKKNGILNKQSLYNKGRDPYDINNDETSKSMHVTGSQTDSKLYKINRNNDLNREELPKIFSRDVSPIKRFKRNQH